MNGDVGTEVQRQAFVHYRALFEKLLETTKGQRQVTGGKRMTTHDQHTEVNELDAGDQVVHSG